MMAGSKHFLGETKRELANRMRHRVRHAMGAM
jgi:hypothetical protein